MSRVLRPAAAALCVVMALVASACTSTTLPAPAESGVGTLAQPEPPQGLPVAVPSDRVDLAVPTFTNPTEITNPLFPVSSQRSVLLLGTVDDQAFRTEVTLLPAPRIISWQGQQVETLVSQYVAFLDGRLHEVAYDLYAQADDGSVWYFGEDVYNFADGAIVDTHGTWTAGIDGPAAMIMPGHPREGDVYRPENIPGFVFEEVTVKAVDQALDGPLGPIEGGLLIEELHMDGTVEAKSFAPGYGEFLTAGGGDVEALALAIPTDAASGPRAPEMDELSSAVDDAMVAVHHRGWQDAQRAVDRLTAAWQTLRAGDIPVLMEPLLSDAIDALGAAVTDEEAEQAGQSAIDTARLVLDLELRYATPSEIDLARFDLWLAQLELDAATQDTALVNGDYFALDYVRDRILAFLDAADMAKVNLALEELLGAIADEDYEAAAAIATQMRETVAGVAIRD